jgi:hypothetical protein
VEKDPRNRTSPGEAASVDAGEMFGEKDTGFPGRTLLRASKKYNGLKGP